MAFFAILRDHADDEFIVKECHLNLWSLSGFFKRRVFFCDVGLRLHAKKKEISKLNIMMPMGTYGKDANGLEDLSDLMVKQEIAALVFGRPASVTDSKITYKSSNSTAAPETIDVVPITFSECTRDDDLSSRTYSFWNVVLSSPIAKEEDPVDTYLRLRFKIRDLGRTWTWKRPYSGKNGALVDVRVTDVRWSFVENKEWKVLQKKIVPIETLNLFVIAPSWLQMRAASPLCHYMRIFEGRVWEPYLKRRVDLRRKEKLIIYQWRNDKPVDANNPFRVLLDLSKEFGLIATSNHLLTAVVVFALLLVSSILLLSYPTYARYLDPAVGWLSASLLSLTSVITVGSFLALVWLIYRFGDRFEKTSKRLRNSMLKWEQNRYRKNLQND